MTCSPWQKLHFGLTVAAHDDDRLTFGCDFASIFFAEVVLALMVVSNTSHRWAIKSNCLSGGSSWPVQEVPHSRNVTEWSLEVRMGKMIPVHRRTLQCLKGVQLFRDPLRDSSKIDWIFPCHKSNIALTWVWIITRLLSYRSLRIGQATS